MSVSLIRTYINRPRILKGSRGFSYILTEEKRKGMIQEGIRSLKDGCFVI